MKLNIATLRINNPNFFKRLQKKTMVNINENTTNENTTNENTTNSNINSSITSTIVKSNIINKTNILQKNNNTNNNNNKNKLHSKTQKLAFKVKDNAFKTIYYPELQGINIKELKEELVREEAEEDLNNTSQEIKIKNESFKIEDMPDINMNEFE